jgi:hypothetical protein
MSVLATTADISNSGRPMAGTTITQNGIPRATRSQALQLTTRRKRGRRIQKYSARSSSSLSARHLSTFNLSSNRTGANSSYFQLWLSSMSCQTPTRRLLKLAFPDRPRILGRLPLSSESLFVSPLLGGVLMCHYKNGRFDKQFEQTR